MDARDPGLWRVTAPERPGLLVYLRPVASAALRAPRTGQAGEFAAFDRLAIDWSQEPDPTVTLGRDGRSLVVPASLMTLHEPIETLYELLPLATFDRAARRFWWRVFLIMQWPGGGRLLSLIARRR